MEQRNEGLVLSVVDNLMGNGCPSRPLVLENPSSQWSVSHLWEGEPHGEVDLSCVMEAGSVPGLV